MLITPSPTYQETSVMEKLRRLTKPVSHLVMLGLLALSLHLPAANAALVGTEAVVNAAQAQQSRARLDSLTDEEVQTLASKMDQLPAGADGLGLLVFIFIVLLITDILGFTNLFPFVKHPKR